MSNNEIPLSVYQWLEEKGWMVLPYWQGYSSPCGTFFISQSACQIYPGDIINFLKTCQVRNIKIFDNGLSMTTPESLGYKTHKDGTCVKLRRVK